MKIKVQPFWDIMVRVQGGLSSKTSEVAVKPQKVEYQALGYYISMQTKENTKSSEISYLDYGYLAKVKYEPIRGQVDIIKNKYNVFIFEPFPGSAPYRSVTVKFYDDDRLVDVKPIVAEAGQNKGKTYSLSYDPGQEKISHLVIEVEYDNGEVFSKEIRG